MVVAPTYLLHSTNIRGYGCYEGETERHRRGEIITLGLRWKYGGNTVTKAITQGRQIDFADY